MEGRNPINMGFTENDEMAKFILFENEEAAGRDKKQRRSNMRRKTASIVLATALIGTAITGCSSQASRVSYNLSKEADNFNVIRRLTVINCIEGDVLFQMTGNMAITADTSDNQLEIVVENGDGNYEKHFVGLSDNVTYVVEDLGSHDVDKYKYALNFNPKMWIPVEAKYID